MRNNFRNFSIRRDQSSTKNMAKLKNDVSNLNDKRSSISTQIRYYKRMETDDLSQPKLQK